MNHSKTILVTGGAGYVGSHTVLELLNKNYQIVVIDNLCNSNKEALHRVQSLTKKKLVFYHLDLRNSQDLSEVFNNHSFDAVIHFAGLKSVEESVTKPHIYYDNNVVGSLILIETMRKFGVHTLLFSSSATVYGEPLENPIKESTPTQRPTSVYGRTKLIIEDIFRDYAAVYPEFNVVLLRYFNPVGAHPSGQLGEDPLGTPNNLVPFIAQVAVGKLQKLYVFGNDYPTSDGTGVRDYIHVVDLALGHLAAINKHYDDRGVHIYNLGTGQGTTVLQMLHSFESACGKKLPYEIKPRRPGDIASCFADPTLARTELNWTAHKTVAEMTADTWRWQKQNPLGYSTSE